MVNVKVSHFGINLAQPLNNTEVIAYVLFGQLIATIQFRRLWGFGPNA